MVANNRNLPPAKILPRPQPVFRRRGLCEPLLNAPRFGRPKSRLKQSLWPFAWNFPAVGDPNTLYRQGPDPS